MFASHQIGAAIAATAAGAIRDNMGTYSLAFYAAAALCALATWMCLSIRRGHAQHVEPVLMS